MASPGTIVRNLTFQSNDLGRNTTIVLAFDADADGLYDTIYPVVWKVLTFQKTGLCRFDVTYTNDLALSEADIADKNLVQTGANFKLKPGQQTTLTLEDDSEAATLCFSPPVDGTSGYLTAENKTGLIQDLAVGLLFDPINSSPVPTLFFKEVEDGSNVAAQCKPVLRIYVESDYQETEVLVDPIDSTAIWEQDLHRLFRNTTFNLGWDIFTERYTLTKTK